MVVKTEVASTFETYFLALADPRSDIAQEHKFVDILAIAMWAVIYGADN